MRMVEQAPASRRPACTAPDASAPRHPHRLRRSRLAAKLERCANADGIHATQAVPGRPEGPSGSCSSRTARDIEDLEGALVGPAATVRARPGELGTTARRRG